MHICGPLWLSSEMASPPSHAAQREAKNVTVLESVFTNNSFLLMGSPQPFIPRSEHRAAACRRAEEAPPAGLASVDGDAAAREDASSCAGSDRGNVSETKGAHQGLTGRA